MEVQQQQIQLERMPFDVIEDDACVDSDSEPAADASSLPAGKEDAKQTPRYKGLDTMLAVLREIARGKPVARSWWGEFTAAGRSAGNRPQQTQPTQLCHTMSSTHQACLPLNVQPLGSTLSCQTRSHVCLMCTFWARVSHSCQ